ncbi:hypothetical protein [Pyruvatibacter sp.]|uniref:hypothetical protein n=1 Tax=Pyruvatibacter sp. TaxID=1981328 RepID=UPI0032EB0B1A
MGTLLRGVVIVIFWALLAAVFVAALDGDIRDVLEDYIPFFTVLDPVIDWLSEFLEALWDAITD